MHQHHQIHITLGGLFEQLFTKCFPNPRIYLRYSSSPDPVFKDLDPIRRTLGSWKPSLSYLCHCQNSFLSNWNLDWQPIYSWLSSLKRRIRSCLTRILQSPYTIYPTELEEQKYWNQAARGQKELQRTDARFAGTRVCDLPQSNTLPGISDSESKLPPLVMYYVPALLPVYRDTSGPNSKSLKKCRKPYISPKTYCKWHRMVFPGSDHPTIKQASKLRNLYDPQDIQEICRISRMLPDNVIFPVDPAQSWIWTPKYQIIWQKWLTSKPLSSSQTCSDSL